MNWCSNAKVFCGTVSSTGRYCQADYTEESVGVSTMWVITDGTTRINPGKGMAALVQKGREEGRRAIFSLLNDECPGYFCISKDLVTGWGKQEMMFPSSYFFHMYLLFFCL